MARFNSFVHFFKKADCVYYTLSVSLRNASGAKELFIQPAAALR